MGGFMQIHDVITRVLLAILIGGVIGFERGKLNRPAGFRTHILVCVGATVISMIQIDLIEETKAMILADPVLANAFKSDIGRMGAQVVTGVGFLGAGTIIKQKGVVKGLTTAASVWVIACIGLAIGMGMYSITLVSSIGVFIAIVVLKRIEDRYIDKTHSLDIEIEYIEDENFIENLEQYFHSKKIDVVNIIFPNRVKQSLKEIKKVNYIVHVPNVINGSKILQDLSAISNIVQIKLAIEQEEE